LLLANVVSMGSIIARTRKDGTTGYAAQIVIKKDGLIVHREAELKSPGGLDRMEDPSRSDRSLSCGVKQSGARHQGPGSQDDQEQRSWRPQMQRDYQPETRRLRQEPIAECGAADLRQLLFSLLSSIFTLARPAWGYPLARHEFEDSVPVLKKLGLIRKNSERDRRPTLEELDKLMALSRQSVRDGAFSPPRPARHH
jgi:hypothetical protein